MTLYTLPASADIVEALVTIYRSVVPQDIGNPSRLDNLDEAYAAAEMLAITEGAVRNWKRMGIVNTADNQYLEMKAREVSLYKQLGETDIALRARIQTPPFAITPDLILSALTQIVSKTSSKPVYLVELPRDGSYCSRGDCAHRSQRMGDTIVIALIPQAANAKLAVSDALRAKRAAGKAYLVQEYI